MQEEHRLLSTQIDLYEINNQKKHSVMNKGTAGRINFIFDYIPPSKIRR